ncbi:hypothetical protein J7E97_22460 [Streptomyces sp. ISL-66]|uniref:hypothetical protein n=1 Tax=Streptomyces sp. ISL-66 TaxID=2819186 RepID=UPI001BE85F1E|nr:hypothetical protein [Streptomyces sp. ISL-66]MBT2470555.1 hypothetical protein [Streptomyces sp. ISL-66]
MGKQKSVVMAVLCVMVAVGVTACGGEVNKPAAKTPPSASPSPQPPVDPFAGLSADQIADKALDTTKAADSLRVKGSDASDEEPMAFDLALAKQGDCDGNITSEGATAALRKVSQTMYMKGDEKFWQQMGKGEATSAEEAAAVAELLKGRWVKISAEEAKKEGLAAICDADALLEPADSTKTGLTKGADTTLDGKKAAVLTKKDGAETLTFYVAKEGEPYLLKFTSQGGKEPKSAEFSDFNAPITVAAPPAEQIIDPSKMGG